MGLSHSFIGRDLLTDLQLSKLIQISDTDTTWNNKVDGLVSLNVIYEGMAACVERVRLFSGLDYSSMLLFLEMD